MSSGHQPPSVHLLNTPGALHLVQEGLCPLWGVVSSERLFFEPVGYSG